ncbi:hypothetical protein H4R19_005315 [Coemansia spiralis]|nr:hypothetical protein H4R19_005315 [Coemansia spiralis]
MQWTPLNHYLLLLLFNVLNVVAFGVITAVAVVNVVDRAAPTNLLVYYGYTGLLSLVLFLSELRAPRLLQAQARFLFTYTGRGIILTYFGCILYNDNHTFNVFACIYAVSLGVVYLVVAWVPFVSAQHGLLHNWSRWLNEGAPPRRASAPVDVTSRPSGAAHGWPLEKPSYRISEQATPYYPEPPVQPAAAPPPPAPVAGKADAGQSAEHAPVLHESNSSFIYGLTAEARPLKGTGDEYLDSIINSPRFAQDVTDGDDGRIAVRDFCSPPLPAPRRVPRSHAVSISSPVPYHVFPPASRDPPTSNIAQVKRALDE